MTARSTSTIPVVTVPTESSFKGHAVLTLPNPEAAKAPGLQFGVRKLALVLAHLDAVKAFVAKHSKPKAENQVAKLMALLKAKGLSEEDIAALSEGV